MKKQLLLATTLWISLSAHVIAQVPSYVPTNGLVGYWPFNGNANDESGNGNNGTVNGATLTTDRFGSLNSAYFFGGNNGVKITVQDAISLRPQTLTLNSWVFISNSTMWNNVLSKRIASSNKNSYAIFESGSNVSSQVNSEPYNMTITINGTQYQTNNSSPISLGTWSMLTSSFDGSIMKFYVNGQLTSSVNFTGTITYSSDPLYFGTSGYFSGQNFSGKLDEIGIWNRALTQQEITALYTNCNLNSSIVSTNVSCNGNGNGTGTVSASGGTAPYTYSWAPSGGTSSTASNLAAGTYTCTISDANQCSITNTVSITEPLPLTITVTPLINNIQTGSNANFNAASQDPTANISWQTKHQGLQWQSIQNSSFYTGVTTDMLTVNAVQLNNHLQSFRAIASKGICSDTSSSTILHISDTCIVTVNDTNFVTVTDTNYINQTVYDTTFVSITDTNYVTIYDTVTTYISVTDTLFIDINTVGLNNNSIINTIKVFPNPSNSILNLNYGNYASLNNYRVKITNALSQIIYDQAIIQQNETIDLSTFGGAGIYYLNIINPQGNIIEVRKIVLQ
jgi:hypothetical protein